MGDRLAAGGITRALSTGVLAGTATRFLPNSRTFEASEANSLYLGEQVMRRAASPIPGSSQDSSHAFFSEKMSPPDLKFSPIMMNVNSSSIHSDAAVWKQIAYLYRTTSLTNADAAEQVSKLLIASTKHSIQQITGERSKLLNALTYGDNKMLFKPVVSKLVKDIWHLSDQAERKRILISFEDAFQTMAPEDEFYAFKQFLHVTSSFEPDSASIAQMRIRSHLYALTDDMVDRSPASAQSINSQA